MTNTTEIKRLIAESGWKKSHIAKLMGMREEKLWRKIQGRTRWTTDDVANFKKVFSLSPEEIMAIFFAEEVDS